MPRVNALISDFSAGEIAPYFFGKTQNAVYYKGCSSMINFMPRSQGGFRKAPGTIFVGHTKTDQVAYLYAIKISATQSYVLEFTNNLVRFWSFTGGALTYLAGKDIVTTYTTAELPNLQFAWMYPDLFIAHQNHPPARIRYSSGPAFAMQNINFVTTTYTFTGNIVAGSLSQISGITLTSPAGVQTIVNLPLPSAGQSGVWKLTDTAAVVPANTYLTQVYPSAVPSASIPAASANMSAAASGAAAADTFTLKQATLPFQSAGNYPRCVAVAYQRVWFANTATNPENIWSSIVGVWDSGDPLGAAGNMNMNLFEGVTSNVPIQLTDSLGNPTTSPPAMQNQQITQNAVADSDGIAVTLSETQSEILWIAPAHDLIVGAADGELVIPANTGSVGISPNTISDSMVSRSGSAAIQAVVLIQGMVFVQLGGMNVIELNWQGANNAYDPPQALSYFSEHLFLNNAITAWDYAQAPETVAYFLRNDGTLAVLNYNPHKGLMAWWQFKTRSGDVITSVAVQTGPNGDVLFIAVTRGANNYIEMLASPEWPVPVQGAQVAGWVASAGDVRNAVYMHACTQKYSAAKATTITVDTSFNGVTMGVVADGAYLGTAVPSAGVLTLPGGSSANYIIVGLLPVTPIVKTMPISPEGQYGPGIVDIKNIEHVGLILYNTLDIQVGMDGSTLQACPEVTAVKGANPTAYTGQPEPVAVSTSNIRNTILAIQSQNPLPCEVTAVVAEVVL